MLQFVCDVVKDTGPFVRIGLDWISVSCMLSVQSSSLGHNSTRQGAPQNVCTILRETKFCIKVLKFKKDESPNPLNFFRPHTHPWSTPRPCFSPSSPYLVPYTILWICAVPPPRTRPIYIRLRSGTGLRSKKIQWRRSGAAIIGGTGDTSPPQHFGWGDANVNVPPTDCPFSKIFRTYFPFGQTGFLH